MNVEGSIRRFQASQYGTMAAAKSAACAFDADAMKLITRFEIHKGKASISLMLGFVYIDTCKHTDR